MAFLFPDFYYRSAYDIDYGALYMSGKRGVIFDLDNTLVTHGAPADERAIELMNYLKRLGFSICFLSNNKEPRVKKFNEPIGAEYIFKGGKPKKDGYLRACEKMHLEPSAVVFVGDQIFTDIAGANGAGIMSILVKRIGFHEEIQIHLKRIIEAPIILLFRIMHPHKTRLKVKK